MSDFYADQNTPYAELYEPERLKHSGIGIASFLLSLLAGLLIFVMVVAAGVMESSTPGGVDENSPSAIFVGLLMLGGGLMDLIALVLGIAGCLQSDRKKLYAILGTTFSGLAILGTIALIIIGSMLPD